MLAAGTVARVNAARVAAANEKQAQALGAIGLAPGRVSESLRETFAGADRVGMLVLPGQRSGSVPAQQLEASLASNPLTSGVFGEMAQANQGRLEQLAARAMGVMDGGDVGIATRTKAAQNIGEAFKEVGEGIGKVETGKLHKDLIQLAEEEAVGGLPTTAAWNVLKRFERGIEARKGAVVGEAVDEIAGTQLVTMRSQVAKEMRDAFGANNAPKGQVLGDTLEKIDEAIMRGARSQGREELVALYNTARSQWSVLRAMDRGGATVEGRLLPGQTARLIKQGDKTGYFGGQVGDEARLVQGTGTPGQNPLGDFYDALRFAQLKPIVGDSGTATRQAVGNMFQGDGTIMGTAARVALRMGRAVTVNPLARRYAAMGPEASGLLGASIEGIKAGGATPVQQAVGAGLGRVLGGL
jgi:hypothetical protein